MPTVVATSRAAAFDWAHMAKRKARRKRLWDFGTKIRLWCTDNGVSLAGLARKAGVSKSSLHNWVSGTRPPAAGLSRVATVTGLSADYWLASDVPYPPPSEYLNLEEDFDAIVRSMKTSELSAWLKILTNPDARARALLLWEASESGRA